MTESESISGTFHEAAVKAASWIQSCRIDTPHGKLWPVNPDQPDGIDGSLYAGYPGIILFFLELYHSTKDFYWLEEAKGASKILINSLPDPSALLPEGEGAGLYTGIAGQGFVLEEVFHATREEFYCQAALRCFAILHAAAQKAGDGVEWSPVTDIISGSAGIGLFLIDVYRKMNEPSALDLAVKTGRRLLQLSISETAGGLSWKMSPDFPRIMPNFSHGTAGIAYFLAALYEVTHETCFLDGTLAGARYLLSITTPDGLVCHHFPDGQDLFYLGWCHGPAGTSRLYYKMAQITGDPLWTRAMIKAAEGLLSSGIPDQLTPGFWNNVGICCGNAGVSDFFLDLHRLTGRGDFLDFARHMTADLLARSTPTREGLKWVHADIQREPDNLSAETGLMKGAAGIGMHLLRWAAFERNAAPLIRMPDTPF
jgi:lantibiotic modifying enzyme